jgi:hypothetical protein
MHFSAASVIAILMAGSAIATPVSDRRDNDESKDADVNIFPNFNNYEQWAICKGKITKDKFPNLQAPNREGGCVRYYQGVDITGVVTETHFFFKDGLKNACDCAAKCLERPASCTNWVWKHAFLPQDGGKRSCTLYSSPNLPSNVTLAYDTANSKGFQLLQPGNNPQPGANAPITTFDVAMTQFDKWGVSGFVSIDTNNHQFC